MDYVPPSNPSIDFDFPGGSYTPPVNGAINFDFGGEIVPPDADPRRKANFMLLLHT